jgi:hypothetical protein
MTLATFAKDNGYCWCPVERLAKYTRLTRRGVQKILRHLEHSGQIRVVIKSYGGRGKATRYLIQPSSESEEVPVTNIKTPTSEHYKPRTEFAVINAETEAETANYDAKNRELSSPDTYLRKNIEECVCNTHTVTGFASTEKRRSKSKERKNSKERSEEGNVPQLPKISEVKEYAAKLGLPESDAEYLHDNWLANGFTNNRQPIRNWQAVVRTRQARGFLPSQKQPPSGWKSKSCIYPQ